MSKKVFGVKLSSMGAVTPYGSGLDCLWSGLQAQACKLQRYSYGSHNEQSFLVALCNWKTLSLMELLEDSVRQVFDNYKGEIKANEIELVLATALGGIKTAEACVLGGSGTKKAEELLEEYSFDNIYKKLQNKFGLGGRGMIISTTCTSGQHALQYASARVRLEGKRVLVAGGDQASLAILHGMNSVRALTQKEVKPFDKARDGLAIGEGAGAILLEPTSARDDNRFAVLEKICSYNEAFSLSSPKKDAEGLINCLKDINAKGELTVLLGGNGGLYNDTALITALKAFYEKDISKLKITALKGYIGHTLGASGIIETIIGLMMLSKRKIIPICGLKAPEEPDMPYVLNTEPFLGDKLLYLSTGFGGNCSGLLLS